ncbi:hypothetical protein TTHERM_001538671 (macronuclear) [Tetrahymena thermophila SB210]|uniref:Uncharacterized protein n=1 Tax=Tetrahymena thermophila (strain SB210) TaxID=312017 RepID=W7X899_TETTS|nr:hypothetical protein TTHERM_001538671 [Tetrahymena thermophila SB210]EWS75600.1 hypothetical protein TTHERM_001538671 [Tetrahymena thermophila SB210]|eukprot:XP_012651900.1 hypothetical protein TTHERM_001538671 [Tetrahymena thermophila SB210]
MSIKNKKSKSQVQPKSSPEQLYKKMDQNIVNNNNLDKNLDNNEEIQSISIIYQAPNAQGQPQFNSQKQIKWQINRRKRNSVFSQSIYKSSHSLQSTRPSSKKIQKVEQQLSQTNIYNINQNLDSTNRK